MAKDRQYNSARCEFGRSYSSDAPSPIRLTDEEANFLIAQIDQRLFILSLNPPLLQSCPTTTITTPRTARILDLLAMRDSTMTAGIITPASLPTTMPMNRPETTTALPTTIPRDHPETTTGLPTTIPTDRPETTTVLPMTMPTARLETAVVIFPERPWTVVPLFTQLDVFQSVPIVGTWED